MFLCQSMIFNVRTSNRKFICPFICCQVHVFEQYPNTLLLNTMMSKTWTNIPNRYFKNGTSPPPDDKFCEYLHYTPKNISIWLRSRGERNTDFVRFVQILPILPLSDRTNTRANSPSIPHEIHVEFRLDKEIWVWVSKSTIIAFWRGRFFFHLI